MWVPAKLNLFEVTPVSVEGIYWKTARFLLSSCSALNPLSLGIWFPPSLPLCLSSLCVAGKVGLFQLAWELGAEPNHTTAKTLYSSLYSYSMVCTSWTRKSTRTCSDNCLLSHRDNNLKNFLLCLCLLDVNVDKPVYFKTYKKSMLSIVGTARIVVLSGGNFSCLATVYGHCTGLLHAMKIYINNMFYVQFFDCTMYIVHTYMNKPLLS